MKLFHWIMVIHIGFTIGLFMGLDHAISEQIKFDEDCIKMFGLLANNESLTGSQP